MTKRQLDLLLRYIDARIGHQSHTNTIKMENLKKELRSTVKNEQESS